MYPVRRQISPHASRLRRDATVVERAIWSALRNRQLGGFKFRRQWTIGRYVADFACVEAMLIVELDGGQHTPERDAARSHYLEESGYRVIRFPNTDVVENRAGVLEAIQAALADAALKRRPSPNPLPRRRERARGETSAPTTTGHSSPGRRTSADAHCSR